MPIRPILLLLLLPAMAWGATTGEKVPTTVQDGTGWTDWTVAQINSSDDNRATYVGTTQPVAGATGMGIDITSSSIDSIIVHVEGHGTGGGPADQDIEVQILIAGTGTGDWVKINLDKNVDSDWRVTGTDDALWATGADEADVEHADFGVQMRDINTTDDIFRIDYVRVEVIYTATVTSKAQIMRIQIDE